MFVQKRLVVVGAVHVHEQASKRTERLDCGRGVVHVHTAASGGGDRAPHDEKAVLAERKSRLVEETVHLLKNGCLGWRRQIELRLYTRLLRAVADCGRIGARAERELQRAHEDALARARLARNDREAVAEGYFSLLDDGEVQH